ncbi:MAG: hypothetical protein CTY39_00435 [Hyphomicrobium sp.]|nr:MAG: hypothetical protein CTY39_00435 [Hyphomicrobium sp.]
MRHIRSTDRASDWSVISLISESDLLCCKSGGFRDPGFGAENLSDAAAFGPSYRIVPVQGRPACRVLEPLSG